MASEEFTTAMAALDGNARALIQAELDRLTQLGSSDQICRVETALPTLSEFI